MTAFRNLAVACALLFVISPAMAAKSHSGVTRGPTQGSVVKPKVNHAPCKGFKHCHNMFCGCAGRN